MTQSTPEPPPVLLDYGREPSRLARCLRILLGMTCAGVLGLVALWALLAWGKHAQDQRERRLFADKMYRIDQAIAAMESRAFDVNRPADEPRMRELKEALARIEPSLREYPGMYRGIWSPDKPFMARRMRTTTGEERLLVLFSHEGQVLAQTWSVQITGNRWLVQTPRIFGVERRGSSSQAVTPIPPVRYLETTRDGKEVRMLIGNRSVWIRADSAGYVTVSGDQWFGP